MKREELKFEIWPLARVVISRSVFGETLGTSPLEQGIIEGDNPVYGLVVYPCDTLSKSRIVWECSPKWVVNTI